MRQLDGFDPEEKILERKLGHPLDMARFVLNCGTKPIALSGVTIENAEYRHRLWPASVFGSYRSATEEND